MGYRFFSAAWLLGMPGVIAVAVLVLPGIVASRPTTIPLEVLQIGSVAQGGLLLAVAVLAGMMFAPEVRLEAPVLSALANRKSVVDEARPQIMPGLVGAVVGAAILGAFARFAPVELAGLQARTTVPGTVRLLYGGITEELLVRWGVMTVMCWTAWRVLQDGQGRPAWYVTSIGITGSAALFGVVHLPAVFALLGTLPVLGAIALVAANSAFGIAMGCLYWRFGLEAAILAHAGAHAIILVASG